MAKTNSQTRPHFFVAGAAGPGLVVLVRCEFVKPQHQQHAQRHADHHHGSAQRLAAEYFRSGREPWQQQ